MSRRRIGFWYRLAAVLVKPPLLVFFKRDWRGMEHIPENGGFITVVNHNSAVDPLSYAHFQYNTGRVPRFLAKNGLFKSGFVGAAMRGTGQIPVYRETKDAIGAFRAAVEAINKGECVAFYPEGTLTREPGMWPMKGKTGAARVALETRAPVIPVAQWGANLAVPPYPKLPGDLRLFPRKTLIVKAGPPIDLSEFYDREPTAAVLREVTERIMDEITRLLADIRGETPPAERYDHRAAADQGVPSQQGPAARQTENEKSAKDEKSPEDGQAAGAAPAEMPAQADRPGQAEKSVRADRPGPAGEPDEKAQRDTASPDGAGGEKSA